MTDSISVEIIQNFVNHIRHEERKRILDKIEAIPATEFSGTGLTRFYLPKSAVLKAITEE